MSDKPLGDKPQGPDEASPEPNPGDQSHETDTPEQASTSTRRSQTRAGIAAALGAARRHKTRTTVAVAVVVALVALGALRVSTGHDAPGWSRTPADAVRGYLTAVAEGHADDAIAYLADPPGDRTFLTDTVLARSHELAPITDISVAKNKDVVSPVTAHFRVGDAMQTETFDLVQSGKYWFVTSPRPVQLTDGLRPAAMLGVPLEIDGVPLGPGLSSASLFPGRHQVTSPHPFVSLSRQFTVPTDTTVVLAPSLNDDGVRHIADAAQARLDNCLAQHTFRTDCLLDSFDPPDVAPDPTTISWSQPEATVLPEPDPAIKLAYRSASDRGNGLAGITVLIDITLHCSWTDVNGKQESRDAYYPPNYYIADATDPDHIVVTFVRD